MSVVMPYVATHELNIIVDKIQDFFEGQMRAQGFTTLDELYPNGIPPLSQYLWDLDIKLNDDSTLVFTPEEINELNQMSAELQISQYPDEVKDTLPRMLAEIKRVKARAEGRNLLHGKIAGVLNSSAKRTGLIGNNRPAMNKILGMPEFVTTVGSFLTNTPRIKRESKGIVDPALANLKKVAMNQPVDPLRKYGTGTAPNIKGGRRKTHTRKGRKNYKVTRRIKNKILY